MSFNLKWLASALILLVSVLGPMTAQAQLDGTDPAKTEEEQKWDDFIHYATIVNIPMAAGNGQALLDMNLSAERLMEVIENSSVAGRARGSDFPKWYVIIRRTKRLKVESQDLEESAEELRQVATQVERMIIDARFKLAREPKRIRAAIEELDGPAEQRLAALDRLRTAGEFAAPELIKILNDDTDEANRLRPWVQLAIEEIGRPIVMPLSEALMTLPPLSKQDVARKLADIGSPVAMPYLQQAIESKDIDPPTKRVLQDSLALIASSNAWPIDVTPEYLFKLLAEDYFSHRESLMNLPDEDWNPLWIPTGDGNVRYMRIPTPMFFDVLCMRMARHAMTLKPDYHQAQSLWVAANFRRAHAQRTEANDELDPSYKGRQTPEYYAVLSGPKILHAALRRALLTRDSMLARDVIKALSHVAGDTTLLNLSSPNSQPLLAAMNYPERRVRFDAALAIAAARPHTPFFGSNRVIPVLLEATTQDQVLNALIIAPQQSVRNQLTATLSELTATEPYQVGSIFAALEMVKELPSVDVMLIKGPREVVLSSYEKARRDFKLQSTPIVVLATNDADFHHLKRAFARHKGVIVVEDNIEEDLLAAEVTKAVKVFRGDEDLEVQEATEYAVKALDSLYEIGIGSTKVFSIRDAQSGLIQNLEDQREFDDPFIVAKKSSKVLALINTPKAQAALADLALNDTKDEGLRIEAFNSLALSAKNWGNNLSEFQNDEINKLVSLVSGDLADSVARAHGALNLPSEKSAEVIIMEP